MAIIVLFLNNQVRINPPPRFRPNLRWFLRPSLTIKPLRYQLLPFRTRFMSSPKHSLPQESRILLAMHVGMPISLRYPTSPFSPLISSSRMRAPHPTGREKSNVTSCLDSQRYSLLFTSLFPIRFHRRIVPAVFQCQVCCHASNRTCLVLTHNTISTV